MFGLNNYGQCGVGTEDNNVWVPERVLGLQSELETPLSATLPNEKKLKRLKGMGQEGRIIGVDLGLQHGIAVDEGGRVYCWGKGERGQVGLWADGGNTTVAGKVRLVRGREDDVRVKDVKAGMMHSVALGEEGEVYVWGKLMGGKEEGEGRDAFWPHRIGCRGGGEEGGGDCY